MYEYRYQAEVLTSLLSAHAYTNYIQHEDFLGNSYASLMPVQHCKGNGEKILYRAVDFLRQILGCHALGHDASKTSERLPVL